MDDDFDPGAAVEAPTAESRLQAIAERLSAGEISASPTVREFLRWFEARRRGPLIARYIRKALADARLATRPDFESAYIDSPIVFVPASLPEEAATIAAHTTGSVAATVTHDEDTTITVGIGDPIYRLSKLAAANNVPVSVAPERSVVDAVTLMLSNDFSQLPVMTSERTVKGMISWRSIGARWALDRDGTCVRQFMDEPIEVPAERSIFAVLPLIVEHGYVLVRDAASRISGIVTTSDLSLQFQQLAEPFLLLGEIENQVRRLMDGKFTKDELATAKDPSDAERVIENVADMTFGEYVRVLQEPQRWSRLKLAIDRGIFIRELDAVRAIRNDVMHFDPDPLPENDLLTLRRFAKFLQALQALGI